MGFFKDVGNFATKNIRSAIKDIGNVANMIVGTAGGIVNEVVNPVIQNFDSISIPGLGGATVSKPGVNVSVSGSQFNLVDFFKKNKVFIGVGGAGVIAALYFMFSRKKKPKRRR